MTKEGTQNSLSAQSANWLCDLGVLRVPSS
jgi:hypothetical protein